MSRLPSQSVRAADKPSGTTSSSDQRLRLSSTQAAQLQAHLRRPFTQLQQRIDIHGDIKHDDTSSASTRKEGSRYATAAAAAAAVAGKENASEQRHSSAGSRLAARPPTPMKTNVTKPQQHAAAAARGTKRRATTIPMARTQEVQPIQPTQGASVRMIEVDSSSRPPAAWADEATTRRSKRAKRSNSPAAPSSDAQTIDASASQQSKLDPIAPSDATALAQE